MSRREWKLMNNYFNRYNYGYTKMNGYYICIIYKACIGSTYTYRWLPGITTYLHFSWFRAIRVFSFASVFWIKINEMNAILHLWILLNSNLNKIFFTIVTRPNGDHVFENDLHLRGCSGNKKNVSVVTWVFRSKWQLYCFSGNYIRNKYELLHTGASRSCRFRV